MTRRVPSRLQQLVIERAKKQGGIHRKERFRVALQHE